MTVRRPLLLAVAGGLLTTLTVPPFGWWPLVFPGMALFAMAAISSRSVKRRMLAGLVFGLAHYVPGLWWMTQFSLPGGVIVALIQAAFLALAMTIVIPDRATRPSSAHPRAHGAPQGASESAMVGGTTSSGAANAWRSWASFVVAVLAADALRCQWPFGGLPLAGFDLGQARGPLAPVVAFGGRLLLVGLCATGGAALASALRTWKSRRAGAVGFSGIASAAVLASLTVGVPLILRALPDGTHRTGELQIAIVQGGGPRGLRASPANARRTYEAHLAATERIRGNPDLVLWPEDVVDVERLEGSPQAETLAAIAKRYGATFVAGVVEDLSDRRFVNVAAAWGPDGEPIGRFQKVRLVPYGEFFWGRSLVENFAALPSHDAVPGRGPGVLRTPAGVFGVAISYEGFFDDRARGGVRAGGEIVLIPTNASSYRNAHVPSQQVAAARLRARETGRWVAQAAPTGFSAVIDNRGRLLEGTHLGAPAVIERAIERRTGLTPYAHFNDAPVLLAAAVVSLAAHAPGLSRRRSST